MAMLPETKYNYAIKKIVGKSHSQNKDFSNEADTSYIPTLSENVWVDSVDVSSSTAVSNGIAEEIDAVLELDVTSNGKSYRLVYPTGHSKQGEYVVDIIPDLCGIDYEPIFWRNKSASTRIFVADAADWFLDPANGRITSEDNLNLDINSRCDVFVYIGKKLSTAGAVGQSYMVEEVTYSSQATIVLNHTPVANNLVQVWVYGGIKQDNGVDYGISGYTITLTGYPLADLLENGDILSISYPYAG